MAVPDIDFPTSQARSLGWLVGLSEQQFDLLEGVVEKRLGDPFPQIVRDFASEADEGASGERAARTLVHLVQFARQGEHSPEEMAEALRLASGLDLPQDKRETLATRVARAITWQAAQQYERAFDLFAANQNLLWDSRIVSDIRPIFPPGERAKPEAALVVHTLELTYWDGTKVSTFYIALDRDELRRLDRVLERALMKDAALEGIVEAANMRRVGTEAGEE